MAQTAPPPATPAAKGAPSAASASPQQAESPDGGSYDVIRRRLLDQIGELAAKAEALNERRKALFGGRDLALIANERVRTQHNCTPRDVVAVSGHLLFGFQLFLGLKAETQVKDVLALQRFEGGDVGFELTEVPFEGPGAFLADANFQKELRDLFKYTKGARLGQMRRTDTRLLITAQLSDDVRDVRVFRFAIDSSGRVTYMDARGEEDDVRPSPQDFTWTPTTREDHVAGKHPHVNILDEVFVETIGGDLTVKIENNTAVGVGIYREPVDDPNQSLDDGDISYARLGSLILLKIKPFREQQYRYFIYNIRAQKVLRVDAIGQACRALPEDHGVIFPGGCYLQTGESKVFEGETEGFEIERVLPSPNGEDVLYVFYRRGDGQYLLMPYNLIRKEVGSLLRCNGYSPLPDGSMAIFRESPSAEPTRVHPVQIWQTPFTTAEHAANTKTDGSYIARVGNADLVRGISDMLTLRRLAAVERPQRATFEDLIASVGRITDAYYWLGNAETGDLLSTLAQIKKTATLIIDEFEKIVAIRKRADEGLAQAEQAQAALLAEITPGAIESIDGFLAALTTLRKQRGALISLRELRSIDLARTELLEQQVVARFDEVGAACVTFLLGDQAFSPLVERLSALVGRIEATPKASELKPHAEELERADGGLALLSELVNGLPIDDTTAKTSILEGIGAAFAQLNRARATLDGRRKDLSLREGRAEFGAQFKLFGQSVTSAISSCTTPDDCDRQLARLLLTLEELEGRFGELDEFLGELTEKRQDITDALGARRQTLVEERQRRASGIAQAADRILAGVTRKAQTLTSADELNAYFASDPMIEKASDLEKKLVELGDAVRAGEIRSRLLSARKDALRALKDRTDLYDGADGTIKLGRHRFAVSRQALELSLVPRGDTLAVHLLGTDFYEPIADEALSQTRDLWEQSIVSETPEVYRAEFLAASMLFDAEENRAGLTIDALSRAGMLPGGLAELIRPYADARLDEGYERGIHDADAARILERLISFYNSAGTLRFSPDARGAAALFWHELSPDRRELLHRRARSVGRLKLDLSHSPSQSALGRELEPELGAFLGQRELPASLAPEASRYLVEELSAERVRFTTGEGAERLRGALLAHLDERGGRRALEDDLSALERHPRERLGVARAWVTGYVGLLGRAEAARYSLEAAVMLLTDRRLDREVTAAQTSAVLEGMLGVHPRTEGRSLTLTVDEFLARLGPFVRERAPRFRAYRKLRAAALERERERLRVDELAPKVLSSFVRNRLIDEVYLPLVGANLAKQLGAAGDQKRTDLMGLLLLVSPPGYGKTTLMEYVADKLGLVFMKVNGPALGHSVVSLDPAEAPNATSRREVEKINLAFEMSNNVMLYLDDIQHTNAELLQKFISLCDAQRRIEGVWAGRTKTYDLRGKRFCVVMAGNPYTESGARFQIPDMLANRADTYNLGDVLDGKASLFEESYLENALTSNPALAPLAGRDAGDVRKLLLHARGEEVQLGQLSHGYSAAEVEEISGVLRRLLKAQSVLGKVNATYIASASQDEAYRTEPPFKLQGSYRNMNKIAEKVVAVMDDAELERLIDDHYLGEAQTLTAGAEQNLLKLAELRGRMTDVQAARWREIKEGFVRVRRMGGKEDDPVARLTGTLGGLDVQLARIHEAIQKAAEAAVAAEAAESAGSEAVAKITAALAALGRPQLEVTLDTATPPAVAELLVRQLSLVETTLVPLVQAAMSKGGDESVSRPLAARLDELVVSLARLEERLAHGVAAPARFEVALDAAGACNFFLPVGGVDVVRDGGLFVATYAKLPALGSPVTLAVKFPGGARAEVRAKVLFSQSYRQGEHGELPGGFGARLLDVTGETRVLVDEFVRAREPLLRDS
jgi:hypothetical protein